MRQPPLIHGQAPDRRHCARPFEPAVTPAITGSRTVGSVRALGSAAIRGKGGRRWVWRASDLPWTRSKAWWTPSTACRGCWAVSPGQRIRGQGLVGVCGVYVHHGVDRVLLPAGVPRATVGKVVHQVTTDGLAWGFVVEDSSRLITKEPGGLRAVGWWLLSRRVRSGSRGGRRGGPGGGGVYG
jgi:hypothetical protein